MILFYDNMYESKRKGTQNYRDLVLLISYRGTNLKRIEINYSTINKVNIIRIYEGIVICREVLANPDSLYFGEYHCVILIMYFDE